MLFPWHKYKEVETGRRNTLQIFITNRCNLCCSGCFARKIMQENNLDISLEEYKKVIENFVKKGGRQINLLGGEPFLHPFLKDLIKINNENLLKTTIYTNGSFLGDYSEEDLQGAKVRISLYCKSGKYKSLGNLKPGKFPFEVCFMVSSKTSVNELLETANLLEKNYKCKAFFISSIRELDNSDKEFFKDTLLTMNLLDYKKLVHEFLEKYSGKMEIHISKRGVFESTKTLAENKCRFANYFIGGKIIQCPYDIVNEKYQKDYNFECRNCQHNNTCLMSKIVVVRD